MNPIAGFIPGILEYLVDAEALTDEIYMLPSSFKEEEMDNPFVFLEFWIPCLIMALLAVFVILPLSVIKYNSTK